MYPRSLTSMGSPSGAVRTTSSEVPRITPRSRSRRVATASPPTDTTLARSPGRSSASVPLTSATRDAAEAADLSTAPQGEHTDQRCQPSPQRQPRSLHLQEHAVPGVEHRDAGPFVNPHLPEPAGLLTGAGQMEHGRTTPGGAGVQRTLRRAQRRGAGEPDLAEKPGEHERTGQTKVRISFIERKDRRGGVRAQGSVRRLKGMHRIALRPSTPVPAGITILPPERRRHFSDHHAELRAHYPWTP